MSSVLNTVLWCFIVVWNQIIHAVYPLEICQLEGKSIHCPGNQVLFIKSAHYGRMNTGRCVKKNMGYIGCGSDVLPLVDKWCSGLKDCTLDEGFYPLYDVTTPCPANLPKYLEISYKCLDVVQPQQGDCDRKNPSATMLTQDMGYISSYVSYRTDCGYARSPWFIQTKAPDRIELTILDFSVLDVHSGLESTCDVLYATIIERNPKTETQICRGPTRDRIIYVSQTNLVEIQIARQINHRFIIHYRSTRIPRLPRILAYSSGSLTHMSLYLVLLLAVVGYCVKWTIR